MFVLAVVVVVVAGHWHVHVVQMDGHHKCIDKHWLSAGASNIGAGGGGDG